MMKRALLCLLIGHLDRLTVWVLGLFATLGDSQEKHSIVLC
jgi:hypothetical protein